MAKEEKEVVETTEGVEETPKKKPKLILIIIIVAAVVILGVVGFMFKDVLFGKEEPTTEVEVEEKLPTFTYPLESMAIRLSDEGKNSYLKISFGLKYQNAEDLVFIEEKKLDIEARLNEVLRTKKSTDLKTLEQTDALKEELVVEVNKLFDQKGTEERDIICGMIFPDFITQ